MILKYEQFLVITAQKHVFHTRTNLVKVSRRKKFGVYS